MNPSRQCDGGIFRVILEINIDPGCKLFFPAEFFRRPRGVVRHGFGQIRKINDRIPKRTGAADAFREFRRILLFEKRLSPKLKGGLRQCHIEFSPQKPLVRRCKLPRGL